MALFLLSLLTLFVGYFILSRVAEHAFGASKNRKTPVETMADGIDYVPLPKWRLFLIELLNIAGLGSILGLFRELFLDPWRSFGSSWVRFLLGACTTISRA